MSASETITLAVTVTLGALALLAAIGALLRLVFFAPLVKRLDTLRDLFKEHYHNEDGIVVAPIRGGANGED